MDLMADIGKADQLVSTRLELKVALELIKDLKIEVMTLKAENKELRSIIEGTTTTTTETLPFPPPSSGAVKAATSDEEWLSYFNNKRSGSQTTAANSDNDFGDDNQQHQQRPLVINNIHQGANPLCVSVTPTLLITGGADKAIKFTEWGLADSPAGVRGALSAALSVDLDSPVVSVTHSQLTKSILCVAAGGMDGRVSVLTHKCNSLTSPSKLSKKHDKFVSSLAFNTPTLGDKNELLLASCSYDGKIHVYRTVIADLSALLFDDDAINFQLSYTYVNGLSMESIVFTNFNELCVAARDVASLRYYEHVPAGNAKDAEKFRDVSVNGADRAYDTHCSFSVLNLQISDDGKLLLAATDKGRNIVFETGTPHIVRNLYGHSASPFSNPRACFSAAGGYVIGSSEDNKIMVWDLRDGKIIRTYENVHHGTIRDMNICGGIVVTCSFDKSVKIWMSGI